MTYEGARSGIFNAVYGVAWFIGRAVLGVVYDHSVLAVAVLAAALQTAALPIFARLALREH